MKNPIVATILAFFPGGGLFYIGKKLRGFFLRASSIWTSVYVYCDI